MLASLKLLQTATVSWAGGGARAEKASVLASVLTIDTITEFFHCPEGVRDEH